MLLNVQELRIQWKTACGQKGFVVDTESPSLWMSPNFPIRKIRANRDLRTKHVMLLFKGVSATQSTSLVNSAETYTLVEFRGSQVIITRHAPGPKGNDVFMSEALSLDDYFSDGINLLYQKVKDLQDVPSVFAVEPTVKEFIETFPRSMVWESPTPTTLFNSEVQRGGETVYRINYANLFSAR